MAKTEGETLKSVLGGQKKIKGNKMIQILIKPQNFKDFSLYET